MFYIVYESRTGQVERFVRKVGIVFDHLRAPDAPMIEFRRIDKYNMPVIGRSFHMLTYTDGFGVVPDITMEFLSRGSNGQNILSIGSSGNKNWGALQYAKAADLIAEQFDAEVSLKWELAGKVDDVVAFMRFLRRFSYN